MSAAPKMAEIDTFTISFVRSKFDNKPQRRAVTWRELCSELYEPRRTDCTLATCGTGIHADLDKDGNSRGCRHKNGRGWSPATFRAGRKKAETEFVYLLVVDLDHLPDDASFGAALGRLERYRYIGHATHSDRPSNRCARIVILLSRPVPAGDWPRFWSAAMMLLGMPADPACCDASRLYFLPARPSDAEYWYREHDGDPLNVDAILSSAPTEAPTVAQALKLGDEGVVGEGQRHAMLKSLAGSMRHRGATQVEIEAALVLANARRCNPPKPESVVKDIAAWAAAQPVSSLPKSERTHREPPRRETRERDDDSTVMADAPEDDIPPPDVEHAPSVDPADADNFERSPHTGEIYKSQRNIMLALRKLDVSLSYDTFPRHELIAGLDGFGPRIDDDGMRELRLRIDELWAFRVQKEFFADVIARKARLNSFHSVRDYLASVQPKWDEKPRIDRWLVDYAGAQHTSYVLAVSRLILVAAVRRARRPGCKFDEMPILESKQGTNKSSALRVLAVRDEWFTDDLPLGGDTKQLIEQTLGKWIIEAGELKGMGRAEVAALKACLSRQVDEARMAYGHKLTIVPRQFVIIGTTNETAGYLRDSTGNRRYWPIRIEQFDLEALRRDRDQLWAEAAHYEALGESIRLDPALYGDATNEQSDREADDPMMVEISESIGMLKGKIFMRDLWALLNIEPGKATQDQNARLGAAMHKLGWERVRRRREGAQEYAYTRGGTEAAIEVTVIVEYGTRRVHVTGGAR
jgi:hypothetical protein